MGRHQRHGRNEEDCERHGSVAGGGCVRYFGFEFVQYEMYLKPFLLIAIDRCKGHERWKPTVSGRFRS